MKIKVLIPVYKREKIFEKVLIRLNGIREWSTNEIDIVCAGSFDDPCYEVFNTHKKGKDEYFQTPNNPISNKFNSLYLRIKDTDFDYAASTGSDDIISDSAWKMIETEIDKEYYHLISFSDCNFYNSATGKAGYFQHTLTNGNRTVGCYRFIHRNLLKALQYKPYHDGRDSGIDYTMETQIKYLEGVKSAVLKAGNNGGIVDIKSNVNIHSFDKLKKIFSLAEIKSFPKEIQTLL